RRNGIRGGDTCLCSYHDSPRNDTSRLAGVGGLRVGVFVGGGRLVGQVRVADRPRSSLARCGMILGCDDLWHEFGSGSQRECVLHGMTFDFPSCPIRGRVYDFSELADASLPIVTTPTRPIPKNRRPDPGLLAQILRGAG